MFNRDKAAEGPLNVELTLEDGQVLKGLFIVPPGRTLSDLLNGGISFLEFEPFGGERTFLAKATVRQVKPFSPPRTPTLSAGSRDAGSFDPYAVLGVAAGASKEDVHRAYLNLAKAYHPDRYATVELPAEVLTYLAAMARRINAAHDTLEAKSPEKPARPEPVFTTPNRA